MTTKVPGSKLRAGQQLVMKYRTRQDVVRVIGVSGIDEKYGDGGVRYQSVADAMKANGVSSLRALMDMDEGRQMDYGFSHHLLLHDVDGDFDFTAYLYKGRWAVGTRADNNVTFDA